MTGFAVCLDKQKASVESPRRLKTFGQTAAGFCSDFKTTH